MRKRVFYILILSAIIIAFIFVISKEEITPKSVNEANLKIGLYSDLNITENAKIKDPRFKLVAFAPSPVNPASPLNQLASVFNAFKIVLLSFGENKGDEYGTWLWTPTLMMTDEYMVSVISNAKKESINVIYLSIDSYLDIYVMPKGPEKTNLEKQFREKISRFISLANENGIEVDAEAGWRNWAEDGHTYKPVAIVTFVSDFNSTSLNKFRGFQYDIEPHILDHYQTDTSEVLKNLVTLVDNTAYYLKDQDLRLSVVIPDFWDEKDGMTPKFEYKNKNDFVLNHLFSILDNKAGSQIILMSYRNFSEGLDGTLDISKNELSSAKWGFHDTKVIIAQESSEVTPPYITFFGTSRDHFENQKSILEKAFSKNPNFGGISVHYANSFFDLK